MTTPEGAAPTAPISGLSHLQLLVSAVASSAWRHRTVSGLVPSAEVLGIAHDVVVLENGHPQLQLRDPDGIVIELVAV